MDSRPKKEDEAMQTKNFFLTLGLGMVAGGAVALMLPEQCKVKQAAQKLTTSSAGFSQPTMDSM